MESNEVEELVLSEITDDTETVVAQLCHDHRKLMAAATNEAQLDVPDAFIEHFVELTVPRYNDTQFRSHFRMNREVFETLCQWVAPHLRPERSVTVQKKLLAAVWLLANRETYRSVADRFGMNRGGLHRIVTAVCQVLTELRGDVIPWPLRCDLARLAGKWAARAGFPGIVGAIDGTYIKIPGTRDENRDAYICRKGFPAMHLQVVCDKELRFLDVFTGYAGSVHDSRVFRNSDLHGVLESNASKLPPEYHMIGDSAYPLRDYLLVPFRDNGHLTPVETAYNRAQARTRVDVERAIGLLKGKFRRLKDLEMTNIREIPVFIFAACVLHNFIIIENGVDEDDIDLSDSDDDDDDDGGQCGGDHCMSATQKRLEIANVLS